MFYENDRIVRKQQRYINVKACDMLANFRSKNMEQEEIKAALEVLLTDNEATEIYIDIVKRALAILNKQG